MTVMSYHDFTLVSDFSRFSCTCLCLMSKYWLINSNLHAHFLLFSVTKAMKQHSAHLKGWEADKSVTDARTAQKLHLVSSLVHPDKFTIQNWELVPVPLRRCLISGGSANGCRQNCQCTPLGRHTTNQRNKTCDVGSGTTSLELPNTHPTRDTQVGRLLSCRQHHEWIWHLTHMQMEYICRVNYGSGWTRLSALSNATSNATM